MNIDGSGEGGTLGIDSPPGVAPRPRAFHSEIRMNRMLRWSALFAAGAMMFQASCDLNLQYLQTALLGGIAGGLYFLARNV